MKTLAQIQTEIDALMTEATEIAKERRKAERYATTELSISGNRIEWDGYSWEPAYDSGWYSSSSDC